MIIDSHAHIIEHLSGMGARGEVRPVGHGRVRFLDGEEMQVIPREIGGAGFSAEQLLEQMELADHAAEDDGNETEHFEEETADE